MIRFFHRFDRNRTFFIFNIAFAFLLFNFLISDMNCRKDLSKTQRFSLTESTEKTLKSLPEKLYIDTYFSSEIPSEFKARIDLAKEMIKEIASVNTDKVEIRMHDPDTDEEARKKANQYNIQPHTLQKVERGGAEVKQAYLGLTLTVGSNTEVLSEAFYAEQLEYQILSTLKKMLRKNESSGVGILQADGASTYPQPGPGTGKDTFGVLIHRAYQEEYGSVIDVEINEEKVPGEVTTLLWIGAPILTDLGKYHIDQFLMRGGNIVILAKSVDFQLQSRQNRMMMGMGGQPNVATPVPENSKISEFTKHYGFMVKPDMILEPENSMPMGPLVQVKPGVIGRYHYPLWVLASQESKGLNKENIFTKDMQYLLLPWTSSIEIFKDKQKDVKIDTLIRSSKEAGQNTEYIMIGEEEVAKQNITPIGKQLPLGIHIEGKLSSYFNKDSLPEKASEDTFLPKTLDDKKSQIVVIGTPYLISDILALNREFIEVFRETNIPFLLNMLDILSGDTDLLEARSKNSVISPLKPIPKTVQVVLSFLNILLVPILISIYAFIRIQRRTKGVKS